MLHLVFPAFYGTCGSSYSLLFIICNFFQRNGSVILENVDTNGNEIPGCQGRLINPGHAIEAGWFLLNHALVNNDDNLKQTAIEKFIELPFSTGWDSKNSGLYYFLDADGFSPTQLEWNMKLWWPHCEALIAFLMAYKETRSAKHFESFRKVFDYTWTHVSSVCVPLVNQAIEILNQ